MWSEGSRLQSQEVHTTQRRSAQPSPGEVRFGSTLPVGEQLLSPVEEGESELDEEEGEEEEEEEEVEEVED